MKQTFKFLTLFLLTLLGTSNLWAGTAPTFDTYDCKLKCTGYSSGYTLSNSVKSGDLGTTTYLTMYEYHGKVHQYGGSNYGNFCNGFLVYWIKQGEENVVSPTQVDNQGINWGTWSSDNRYPDFYWTGTKELVSTHSLGSGDYTFYCQQRVTGSTGDDKCGTTSYASEQSATFTIPGFTTTSTSKSYTAVVSDNSSQTISFGTHYGTTLSTSNCSITGTNSSDFTVTDISESGVTVKFAPSTVGTKSATLTITDAHSKKCTISLTGTAKPTAVTGFTQSVTDKLSGNGSNSEPYIIKYNTNVTVSLTADKWSDGNAALQFKVGSSGSWTAATSGTTGTATIKTTNTSTTDNVTIYYRYYNSANSIAGAESSTTIYYKSASYSVTLNANGGSIADGKDITSYNYGAGATLPTAPDEVSRAGYDFDGWFLNNTGDAVTAIGTDDSGNKSFTARWTQNIQYYKLTLSIGADGSLTSVKDNEGNTIDVNNVVGGTTVIVTVTPNLGYEVDTWTCGDASLKGGNTYTTTISANTEIGVTFKETKYNVNVTKGANVSSVSPTSVSVGQINASGDITATPATGYELDGWTLGTGITIAVGINSPIKIKATQAGTITAKAKAKSYTISFDQNGGEGGSTNVTATYNAAMPSATMPTKLGYKFLGYFDAEKDGTQYYNADGSSAKNWDKDQNEVTLYAYWVKMYFFIEGRFHVANAERTPHGAVWTNTFTNEGWEDNSRTIPMVWNEKKNRFEVRTFATPKELSTELGTQQEKTPWFYIKASESATEWTNPIAYYSATEEGRILKTAGIETKSAVGTEQKYFYFDPETTTMDKWTILCYDAEGVYFVLENIPPYYFINVSVAEGDENKGTVKPTVMNEINTLAYGTAKAESKDPQLYSFEKWGWKSNGQQTESFEFTNESAIILHDSCQNTWPEIRVNADGTDLMLIAHFKAREIVTLYFVDSENWGTNIRMHLWGGFEQGTTWPGIMPNETDLTCNGHKVYSYTFDKGAYEKVKWSNNSNDKSSNFIIDPELPYYNEHDGRWYDALSSIGPDKTICSQWRVVFNNSDEYFKLVEGQTNVYECFLANVPAWEKEGDNWVKMKYKGSGDWEWRGFHIDNENLKVTTYPYETTSDENSGIQYQLNLAGIAEGQTQDFVMTFNTNTKQLTIAYPTPKVEIGVKDIKGALITESDIDSEEGFVLNAYPQNVDKDAQCTYSFQYQKDGGTWTTISGATAKSNTIMDDQLNGPGVYKFKVTMTTGGRQYESQASTDVTIYKYYWVAIKDNKNDNETSHWATYLYSWGPNDAKNAAYPGQKIATETEDLKTRSGWIYYRLKYPKFNSLLLTNGQDNDKEVKTHDININPTTDLCYRITGNQEWDGSVSKSFWPTSTTGCPHRIFIDNDVNEYWMSVDGALSISPKITYYGTGHLTYTWSTTATNLVLSSTDKPSIYILASAVASKATLKLTVTDGEDIKYYDFFINTQNGINIRVWKRYDDWTPVIHIWAEGHNAEDHNMNNEGNGWYSYPIADTWAVVNFMVKKNYDTQKNNEMTLNVTNVTESGCWKVSEYTWNDGVDKDKHLIDKTEDCGLYYRVEETLADGKTTYHSNKVKKANEAVSFYAANDGKLALQHYDEKENKYVDVKVIDNPDESNVQQATFTGNDITGMTKYTGDYYIRTDGAKGGWSDYKQAGNKLTSFTRNPLFGNEKYNYYWVTTLKGNDKNAKAEVGNEINKCLAQTIGDYVCNQGDANVRFGYCPETNYFTRAIIAGSSVADYLTLYGDNSTYFNGGQDNSTLYTDEQLTHKIYDGSQLKFKDLSDWVYEAEVYAAVDVTRPSDTKAVIKSKYHDQIDYLLGYDSENQRPSYAYTVLGNTSTKNMTFKITVTYDYKMNRLTTAWMPLAGEIDGHLSVDAAIMFVNPVDNGDDVQQITVKDKNSDISSLNNIVYVMEFKETIDVKGQNKETNHWISLPFDCRISDIYGIEGYVTLNSNKMPTAGVWGIQRYDGEGRASKGRMTQSDTYWTWMGRDEELKAGEGYVLSFDRGAIDWPEIEGTRIKRLYFQSKTAGFTLNLSEKEATQEVAEHVENASLHRYGEDANWNLIGPLAYNNITIDHLSDDAAAPKFLYDYLGKNAEYVEGIGKYRLVNPLDDKGGDTQFKFHSFHSYMVQFAGDINWAQYTQTQQDNPATAPLMATADAEFTYTQVRLNLSKGAQLMDKTYVCLSATGTTGYDLNDDLSKITEAKANQLGSSVDGRIYAANTLPLETEMVALYVNAASAGEYTIALNEENPYLQVSLFDAQTGMTTPLEDVSYTLTLEKGEYKDRFFLQFKQKGADAPTSFDGKLEQYNLPMDKTQKLLFNGNIYLINAGRVYNATGAELR